ncbi:unnamed protein product [Gordionus sp. m RMFG-2023]
MLASRPNNIRRGDSRPPPLTTINTNSLGQSAGNTNRRMREQMQIQLSLPSTHSAPSANRGNLMRTSNDSSSLRAMTTIVETAPCTSGSQILLQNNDPMELWENQLLLP